MRAGVGWGGELSGKRELQDDATDQRKAEGLTVPGKRSIRGHREKVSKRPLDTPPAMWRQLPNR